MRVIQVLPVLSFGDAVGNDTRALYDVLKKEGYNTAIYAAIIDNRLPKGTAYPIEEMPKLNKDDVMIYHMSTGHEINYILDKVDCKKILQYHNITPPEYFKEYNKDAQINCIEGYKATKYFADKVEYGIADSSFNKEELVKMGYKCPIDVLPILIPFEDYEKKPNKNVIRKYSDDGYTNILFTGRIAPNKKQEDVIDAFYYYKNYINPKSRLIFVGNYGGMERYYGRLKRYVEELKLKDVIFTGHIKFDEILAYYRVADVFLCMSEHEGFCVPLVEAMYFKIPVIARDTSAISDTLGGSGILLKDNDPIIAAEMINKVVTDSELRNKVIANQTKRCEDFDNNKISKQFMQYIRKFTKAVN